MFLAAIPRAGRISSPRAPGGRRGPRDRGGSLVEPGTSDPPFTVLYVRRDEAVGGIRNATVHAFSVLAMQRRFVDYRLYWAIYVRPVGRITAFYMALIGPFRRFIVYPSILRHVHRTWCARHRA